MRRLAAAGLVFAAGWFVAGCYDAPYLVVHVSASSDPGAAQLQLVTTLSKRGMASPVIKAPSTPSTLRLPLSLALKLPKGTRDDVRVDATAVDGHGAWLAGGSGTTSITGDGSYDLYITLTNGTQLSGDLAGVSVDLGCGVPPTCADPSTLVACGARTTCALGCALTPSAHCQVMIPTAPVTRADLLPQLPPKTFTTGPTSMNTKTGEIAGMRGANADPNAVEVINGIAFHVAAGVGVFSFGSPLTIEQGALVRVIGGDPAAIVTSGDLVIDGVVQVYAGGGAGGPPGSNDGDGAAPGKTGKLNAGGGGGGFGAEGGVGKESSALTGGVIAGDPAIAPIRGGSGGGAGGSVGTAVGGSGGDGGGGLQLVADHSITIGASGPVPAGVNAGGVGGHASMAAMGPGGGGGSGGAIVLESLTLTFGAAGFLSVNGGGGGGGDMGSDGTDGGYGTGVAAGGSGGTNGSAGGEGGHDTSPEGKPLSSLPSSRSGGGGGGGAGRMRVSSLSGKASVAAAFELSPTLDDTNSRGEKLAVQTKVTVQ